MATQNYFVSVYSPVKENESENFRGYAPDRILSIFIGARTRAPKNTGRTGPDQGQNFLTGPDRTGPKMNCTGPDRTGPGHLALVRFTVRSAVRFSVNYYCTLESVCNGKEQRRIEPGQQKKHRTGKNRPDQVNKETHRTGLDQRKKWSNFCFLHRRTGSEPNAFWGSDRSAASGAYFWKCKMYRTGDWRERGYNNVQKIVLCAHAKVQ